MAPPKNFFLSQPTPYFHAPPPPKRNPAIEVEVRHFQSQHILQYIASLRASAQRARMYAYAYVHAHTHRSTRVQRGMENCTRYYQTMLCGIFFFFQLVHARFSLELWWGYAR